MIFATFRLVFSLLILLSAGLFSCFVPRPAYATLSLVKDTITSSRPSASTPLQAIVAASSTQATVFDNLSRFIASDSARFMQGTPEDIIVASMSAANTPAANQRVLYFTSAVATAHSAGSVIRTPVTAKHTISFTTTGIPNAGKVQIIFPVGDTSDQSSPSATGFSFNGLVAGNVAATGISVSACTPTAATGTIECVLSAGFAGGAVTVTVGSTTPALVNPTKTAAAGTADTWSIQIKTYDASATPVLLDSVKVKIGTIDSVEVYATVDPSFSFTIAGKTTGAAVNVGNTTGCTNTELINTGISSSATDVNLGVLTAAQINISSQLLTITTNGSGGYVLTATSGGHLLSPESGYWINDAQSTPTNNDTPVPVFLTTATTAFGIHPCGLDVTAATWGTGATGGGAGAKYANPSPTYYYTLATDTTGPIDNSIAAGNGLVTVEYAGTISAIVPAGFYRTYLTYVATPSF